jgi:hypothetical protein
MRLRYLAVLVLAATVARADYVTDGTIITPKANYKGCAVGRDPSQCWGAGDANEHADALAALRTSGTGFANLKSYGLACDGATDDRAALVAAIASLGAAEKTLLVPGVCLISAGPGITIPSNLRVWFLGNGAFSGAGAVAYTGQDVSPFGVTASGGGPTKRLEDWMATGPVAASDALITATGSSTARSAKDRAADKVNVLDFIPANLHAGIKDRTGVTDLSSYVQAAIDATLGEVVFPAGTYWFSSSLTVRTGRTLTGAGKSTGLTPGLHGTYLNFSTIPNANVSIVLADVSDVRIQGFYIQGHTAAGTGPELRFTGNNRRVRLADLAVVGSGTGMLIDFNSTGGSTINSTLDNIVVSGSLGASVAGVYVGAACTSIDINSVYANALPVGVGFQIMGTYITLHSCAADANLWGYYVYGAKSVSIVGSGAEQSVRSALWVRGVDGLSVVGFRSYENSKDLAVYPSFLYLTNGATRVSTLNTLDDGASVGTYSIGDDGTSTDGLLAFIHHSSSRPIHSTLRYTSWSSGIEISGRVATRRVAALASGGAAQDIDAAAGNEFVFSAADGVAFTINAPTNAHVGQRITVRIRNSAGAPMGVITWPATFKMSAWTNPAANFSRSIDLQYDGTNWIEVSRTPADVPV